MRGLEEFRAMIAEGRVGFRIDEAMIGEHEFEPKFGSPEKRPMEFRVTWGPRHIFQWANPAHHRFMVGELEGMVTIDGLCYHTPCTGSLELRYLKDHTIRYTFGFKQGNQSYTVHRREDKHPPVEPAPVSHDLFWPVDPCQHRRVGLHFSHTLPAAEFATVHSERQTCVMRHIEFRLRDQSSCARHLHSFWKPPREKSFRSISAK